MASRRSRYVATRRHKVTGETHDFHVLVYASTYEAVPDVVHREFSQGCWEVIPPLLPINVWRKRQQVGVRSWDFDRQMIDRVTQKYGGNRFPLILKKEIRQGGRRGVYKFDGKTHTIAVKEWVDVEQASITLHHEIQHAIQAETVAHKARTTNPQQLKKAWDLFLINQESWSYRKRPIEIEARKAEERHKEFPLTIQR